MEFGSVFTEELDSVDFSLPKEPAFNKQILPGKKNESAKVYIGCAKWGRLEWVGKIYPEKTKTKRTGAGVIKRSGNGKAKPENAAIKQ